MTDIDLEKKRSVMMSGIKNFDTKPESLVRKCLYKQGFRYKLKDSVSGIRPDVLLRKYKVAIFVHGCYWHRHEGCKLAYNPKSRIEFWESKFKESIVRDKRSIIKLKLEGWRVAIIWECATRKPDIFKDTMVQLHLWIKGSTDEYESRHVQIT